ncbi:MAG: YIP1 family protein [Candidatus Eremiobacteraeota bacterium]|nr:YIP1 family protein [Candidatus Eremiobacteraeota bacterium]
MSAPTVPLDRRSALLTIVDIVIAPNAAFDRLRAAPTWVWAFIVAALLAVVGSLLSQPAMMHALQTSMPAQLAASPQIAKLPPDQQQRMIALQLRVMRTVFSLLWLIVPVVILIIGLIQALIMLIANAVGRGSAGFKQYFALSMNAAVVGSGLAGLVIGVIVMVRGAGSFETTSAVQSVLPSLALLAPGARGALAGFLAAINVFSVWAAVLLALGMCRMGRVAAAPAWIAAALFVLSTATFSAFGAAQQR